MIYLKQFSCGYMETNAWLAGDENSGRAILIDAPPESYDVIIDTLKNDNKELEALLITHSHFDHILDAHRVAGLGVPVIAFEGSESLVAHPEALGLYPPEQIKGVRVTHTVHDGEKMTLAGLEIEVLYIPGHCEYSAGFYIKKESICFVGDAIFKDFVGSTDYPGGNFDVLAASIRKKIYTLPENVVLLSGHGPSTTVGNEKISNKFVKEE